MVVSGIRILLEDTSFTKGDRRSRVILAISLGFGIGVTMKPGFIEPMLGNSFKYGIWPKSDECEFWQTTTTTTVNGTTTTTNNMIAGEDAKSDPFGEMQFNLWTGYTNCAEWSTGRSWRDAIIMILKTPVLTKIHDYCYIFLIAWLLALETTLIL